MTDRQTIAEAWRLANGPRDTTPHRIKRADLPGVIATAEQVAGVTCEQMRGRENDADTQRQRRRLVVELHERGVSAYRIARLLRRSHATILQIIHRVAYNGNV